MPNLRNPARVPRETALHASAHAARGALAFRVLSGVVALDQGAVFRAQYS